MIDKFYGDYGFLSNFWLTPVVFDGEVYPSSEHAFQAAKSLDKSERKKIRECETPGKAKRMGARVALRSDWETIKDGVMLDLIREKFKDKDLRDRLIATGTNELIEGNNWNDTYWGVCNSIGKNMLGKLLMQVRNEIKS
jgi:hypothetical protein